jgi:hypothetical protein
MVVEKSQLSHWAIKHCTVLYVQSRKKCYSNKQCPILERPSNHPNTLDLPITVPSDTNKVNMRHPVLCIKIFQVMFCS